MRTIKKFDEFISSKTNEDIDSIETPEILDEFESEDDQTNTVDRMEIPDDELSIMDEQPEDDDLENTSEIEEPIESNYEEEESGEYRGTVMMNQLAEMLGSEVINNEIKYDGKEINYYSETDKFHVDGEKFETPEEVMNYLNGRNDTTEITNNEDEIFGEHETELDVPAEEEIEEVIESKKIKGFRNFR